MSADDFHHFVITELRKAAAPVFFGDGHAEDAQSGQALDHFGGDVRLAIDGGGIDLLMNELPHLGHGFLDLRLLLFANLRIGENQGRGKLAEKQALGEPQSFGSGK